jgi:nitroreductase
MKDSGMDIDELLTTTRSARKSLDLEAPVDREAIADCLRIGMQAANGSNQQSWKWLAVIDESLRGKLAALYRDAYLQRVGGQLIADLLPADMPGAKIMSPTVYGSIFPAGWNFALALHARGYGTCVTTLHLAYEHTVRELLGIPETYVQGCLLPVGRLRAGVTFRPATRRPIDEAVAVDTWEGAWL